MRATLFAAYFAELLAKPEKRFPAIEEALRLNAVTGLMPRYTENDITVAGVNIPAHSHVLFGVPSANRDEKLFSDPLKFVPGRSKNSPLTFGIGPHFCLGVHLAREEIKISVNQLLDRLPGLRLVSKKGPISGTLFRLAPETIVRFDVVLPA